MTTFGLALALAAAACHAVWNFFAKRINGGPELIWLFSVLSLIIYAPMALWIVVVEKPVTAEAISLALERLQLTGASTRLP